MKTFLNKFSEAMITVFIVVLLIIASPLIFIWLVIATTRDYFKYKESRYYQDTREKYSWLCARSYHVTFYNDIKDAKLPINYYRNDEIKITGYGYFIYNNTLILCDYDSDTFFFDKEEIKRVNEFLGEEICKKAILFVQSDSLENAPEKHYEKIDFLPVTDDNKISALRNIIV